MPLTILFAGRVVRYEPGHIGHLTEAGELLILDRDKRIAARYPSGWTLLPSRHRAH